MSDWGSCPKCGKELPLFPLYGERGGPIWCSFCAGAWHGEHTKRRRWGRIIIKAMQHYEREGGRWTDFDKMKLAAMGCGIFTGIDVKSIIGFEADDIGAEVGDITAELLADTVQLTHPDRHPPERQELARRVTQELLALKPFVFPAPKPKSTPSAEPRNTSSGVAARNPEKPVTDRYPCELCVNEVPYYYCTACRAKWDEQQRREREILNAKQRKCYARRQYLRRLKAPPVRCGVCGGKVNAKRKDARHCSDACRQRAHRQRVTGKTKLRGEQLISRDGAAA